MAFHKIKTFRGHSIPFKETIDLGKHIEQHLPTNCTLEDLCSTFGFNNCASAQNEIRRILGKIAIALRNEIKL